MMPRLKAMMMATFHHAYTSPINDTYISPIIDAYIKVYHDAYIAAIDNACIDANNNAFNKAINNVYIESYNTIEGSFCSFKPAFPFCKYLHNHNNLPPSNAVEMASWQACCSDVSIRISPAATSIAFVGV